MSVLHPPSCRHLPPPAEQARDLERLAAHAADWMAAALMAAVVFTAVGADQRLFVRPPVVARTRAPVDVAGLRRDLLGGARALDPFAPWRWNRSTFTVVGAGDVGGRRALARSSYGRLLARHGAGDQASLFFRDRGRIAAAAVVWRPQPIRSEELQLLRRAQPFLEHAVQLATRPARLPGAFDGRAYGLTQRELEVARLAAAGATNAEIARALCLSLGTVKTHMASVLTKCGARSRTELSVRVRQRSSNSPAPS